MVDVQTMEGNQSTILFFLFLSFILFLRKSIVFKYISKLNERSINNNVPAVKQHNVSWEVVMKTITFFFL